MKITFCGDAHEVTGSCTLLEACGKTVMVDCGMEQGNDVYENQELPIPASDVDYVLLTHAHIDNSGLIPLLYVNGFRGSIYCTEATVQLCDIMLRDSAHIQMFEAEWRNRKAKRAGKPEVVPMYDMNDAMGVLTHFVPCEYNSIVEICDGLKVRFVDAGHLLGSSSIEMWIREDDEEVKVVFSGDIGNGNRPLIKDPQYIKDADYVVMESTYGDKEHETPPDYAVALAGVLKDTFTRGGNLVIPAFSVGRTQEMLYFIRRIKTEHLLPEFEDLTKRLNQAATIINNEVSAFMLLQEVINDVYTILLTIDAAYEKNEEDVPGYAAALRIIKACVKAETIDQLPDEVMDEFFTIEGVQERVYESIVILEAVLDEIRVGKAEQIESLALTETFDRLDKVSKLLSTSLFIDLDKVSRKTETADHAYITAKKEALVKELGDLFSSVKRPVYRSMMCKLLAAMPIFMNTQQEIRDYFDYVIENCKDDSELMACNKLISEMIEE